MKYIIILGDGMADEPIESLGNKTPLQVADTPCMDYLAKNGNTGLLDTIPPGMSPGSEVANLSVLGYDVTRVLEGRGTLEAASMNVDILPGEMAMRCNLITVEDGKIKNHSAGHISNEEAEILIDYLNKELGNDTISFYPGVSYRHVLKIKNGDKRINCTPPHDVMGTPFRDVLPHAIAVETRFITSPSNAEKTAQTINDLIFKSQELLENHPVNLKRKAEGKDPANCIWPWSPGYKPQMEKLTELYPIRNGAVISAVDLIRGIGVYAGLDIIEVEGITGLYDTNYEGKAKAAIEALKIYDFVYLHVEASDEAGHEGDVELKIRTIEYLDRRIIQPILEETENWEEDVVIAVLPDHPTPCRIKTHTNEPVPFLIYRKGMKPDEAQEYNEFSAKNGKYGLLKNDEFIKVFLTCNDKKESRRDDALNPG